MSTAAPATLEWTSLPAIPDQWGFAGSFAGASRGALFVAGGTNFPGRPPWAGGVKTWHDHIFILEPGAQAWRSTGQLPHAAGYGVSLTTSDGVLLIGGGEATRNSRDVLRASWTGHGVEFEALPPLPLPLAMLSGALLGRTVLVAGGLDAPATTEARSIFLSLDLDNLTAGWKSLAPWPGPERFLATASSDGQAFYLFGGARLVPDAEGRPRREWLRDAWRYTSGRGWKRLADLPRPNVGAPSLAATVGRPQVLVFGGDDGSQVHASPEAHPGFPRALLAYDTAADSWSEAGTLPFSLVTTTVVPWNGRLVIPGGEARPGVRSNAVWAGQIAGR